MKQYIVLKKDNSYANINMYNDIELDKIETLNAKKNNTVFKYKNSPLYVYTKNNDFFHNKITYATNDSGDLMTIKNIGDIRLSRNVEAQSILRVNDKYSDKSKSYFINSVVSYPNIFMDFFEINAYDLITKYGLSLPAKIQLFDFIFDAMTVIHNDKRCFTDIKLEQVLLRSHSKTKNKYHTIKGESTTYDVALSDLDYKVCTENSIMVTYTLPDRFHKQLKLGIGKEAELHTLWAFGATILSIFGIDESHYISTDVSTNVIKQDLQDLFALPIPTHIKNIARECLLSIRVDSTWNDVVGFKPRS